MHSEEFATAYADYQSDTLDSAGYSIAGYGGCDYKDYWEDGCTESRVGFSFEDYYRFRPEQAVPKNHNHVMYECQRIYREHGVVKNILDLMVDFTTAGICVCHPQPNIERLGRKWFDRVQGTAVSTQFNLGLYLFGVNLIDVYRSKLTIKQKRQLKDRATAKLRTRMDVVRKQGTVPYKYKFLNPVMVNILGGPINMFVGGEPRYGIRIPLEISRLLERGESKDLTTEQREILDSMPKEIVEAIRKSDGFSYYPLDRPLSVYQYRKHDWQPWANPILMSIYRDLRMLEQAQLADMAALDGAINQITIIKLGDLDKELVPTKAAFQKLKAALAANTGGGPRILTWGPDITIEQSDVEIQKYLDPRKYEPIMERIYGGLGIPPSMTGATGATGSTNNLVSLRGFVERLVYGRAMLLDFWKQQFADFAREMNIKTPFEIQFDIPNLGDVETEKKLLIELYDRNVVSAEYIQQKFGAIPSVEKKRTLREKKDQDSGRRVKKGGPWHNPEAAENVLNLLIQEGKVRVDELGLIKKDKQPLTQEDVIEEIPMDGGTDDSFKPGRRSVNGRPPGSKDSGPRQRNKSKPVLRASKLWAKSIQKDIQKIINPVILDDFNKKNMRSLTAEEAKTAEYVSVGTLFSMEQNRESREDILLACAGKYDLNMINEYFDGIRETESALGRFMTMDEKRDLAAEIYAGK